MTKQTNSPSPQLVGDLTDPTLAKQRLAVATNEVSSYGSKRKYSETLRKELGEGWHLPSAKADGNRGPVIEAERMALKAICDKKKVPNFDQVWQSVKRHGKAIDDEAAAKAAEVTAKAAAKAAGTEYVPPSGNGAFSNTERPLDQRYMDELSKLISSTDRHFPKGSAEKPAFIKTSYEVCKVLMAMHANPTRLAALLVAVTEAMETYKSPTA